MGVGDHSEWWRQELSQWQARLLSSWSAAAVMNVFQPGAPAAAADSQQLTTRVPTCVKKEGVSACCFCCLPLLVHHGCQPGEATEAHRWVFARPKAGRGGFIPLGREGGFRCGVVFGTRPPDPRQAGQACIMNLRTKPQGWITTLLTLTAGHRSPS